MYEFVITTFPISGLHWYWCVSEPSLFLPMCAWPDCHCCWYGGSATAQNTILTEVFRFVRANMQVLWLLTLPDRWKVPLSHHRKTLESLPSCPGISCRKWKIYLSLSLRAWRSCSRLHKGNSSSELAVKFRWHKDPLNRILSTANRNYPWSFNISFAVSWQP
jgi:hypothetical protein